MRSPRRILIIKPSSLGDIVQALPVLAALRDAFPSAQIGWLAADAYADFLTAHPLLDHVFPYRRHPGGSWSLVVDQTRLARELAAFRAELAIDLQGLARSAWFTLLSGAALRVGMSDAREAARLAYNEVVPISKTTPHAVDRYLAVARRVTGCPVSSPRFPLPTEARATAWAETLLERLGTAPVVVAPGARWPTKRWPPEQYAGLIDRLAHRGVGPFVLVGSASDVPLAERIRAATGAKPLVDLTGQTDLLALTELVRRARLFIGNDSGPTHLAAAAGCPTVVLFTCTSPRRALPRGAPVRPVQATVPCVASYRKQCSHLSCHATITVERVTAAALALLEAANTAIRRTA